MDTLRTSLLVYVDAAPDLRDRTIRKLGYLVTSWEKRTSNPPIREIGPDVFNGFRKRCLRDGLSPHSIETSITDVLTILKANGIVADAGRRLKRDDPDPQCPTLTDLGRWYLACESVKAPDFDRRWCRSENYIRAFFVTALWTGFRLSDLFVLTHEDFTSEGIRRKADKTRKLHVIPTCPVVDRHIAALGPIKGPLFPAGNTCPTRLRNWMHAISDAAGVPRFTPQNLRIAAVNAWRDAGGAEAAGIVHGESLGGRGAIRWYLTRSTPFKVLTLAAPRFAWPAEVLLPAERDNRNSEIEQLVQLAKRLQPEQLKNLRRCAVAFAD